VGGRLILVYEDEADFLKEAIEYTEAERKEIAQAALDLMD
jgi:spore maturation protein CgeB